MSALADNVAAVRARIEQAAKRAGRQPDGIRLIAVSKRKPTELIREALALGEHDFGENYAQELSSKAEALGEQAGLRWHMIGHLQRNKVRQIVRHAHALHTLDSTRLLQEVDTRAVAAGVVVETFIAVNLGVEAQKNGVAERDLPELVDAARRCRGVELVGLMAIPPNTEDPERTRPYFARLRGLARQFELPRLSMGMSGDFEVAIEEGATEVRVGTALFGARDSGA